MSDKAKRWWPIWERWCVELGVSQSLVLAVIHMESGGNENARRYEPEYLTKEHTALSIAQLSRFAYFDHGKLPDGLPMTLAVVIGISKHPTLLPIRRSPGYKDRPRRLFGILSLTVRGSLFYYAVGMAGDPPNATLVFDRIEGGLLQGNILQA